LNQEQEAQNTKSLVCSIANTLVNHLTLFFKWYVRAEQGSYTVISILARLFSFNSYDWRRKAEEEYLSKATDLVDLERRQKALMAGRVTL
jgi:hypothetical protein